MLAHLRLFPGFHRGDVDFAFKVLPNPLYELGHFTDCWGTVWENIERGLDSHPIGFPLENWDALASYVPPDPLTEDSFGPRDWEQVKRSLDEARARGDIATAGGLQHGFMYMRLFYLRRFENLMMDMATDEPRLQKVIGMVESYNSAVIHKNLELGPEMMSFGDDLGLQRILPMGPALWRKYIKPSYDRMFAPCRAADMPDPPPHRRPRRGDHPRPDRGRREAAQSADPGERPRRTGEDGERSRSRCIRTSTASSSRSPPPPRSKTTSARYSRRSTCQKAA